MTHVVTDGFGEKWEYDDSYGVECCTLSSCTIFDGEYFYAVLMICETSDCLAKWIVPHQYL